MTGVPPSTVEIRCSLETWSGAGKLSNRHNFGCRPMTASDSVFDSEHGFYLFIYFRINLSDEDIAAVGIAL